MCAALDPASKTMDNQVIADAIAKVWKQYYEARSMPVSTMISLVLCTCGDTGESLASMSDQVRNYLKDNTTIVKGRMGGIMRPTLTAQFNASVARDLLKEVVATNDHKCPSCGNDRVSKCEKSCWKCGSNLHK